MKKPYSKARAFSVSTRDGGRLALEGHSWLHQLRSRNGWCGDAWTRGTDAAGVRGGRGVRVCGLGVRLRDPLVAGVQPITGQKKFLTIEP